MSIQVEEEPRDRDVSIGLNSHNKHQQRPSPVSLNFEAPEAAPLLTFSRTALAAAVARTATTHKARPQLLASLTLSALAQLECLISDGPTFELTSDFADLADTESTLFAARCGAGITDLYMNALGYVWRANAVCLSKTLQPHADFLYGGGNVQPHGVVLAEAHGSFAANASDKTIAAQAKRKYMRQVKPYVNVQSPFGLVVHGYSIAFGSKPSTTGAFLSLEETRISRPKTKPVPSPVPQIPPPSGVSTSIALATHRSNFFLMGIDPVVDWIDWVTGMGEAPADTGSAAFTRLQYAGRQYLGSFFSEWAALTPGGSSWSIWEDPIWIRRVTQSANARRGHAHWFVMEETACVRFLNSLAGIIRSGRADQPRRLDLPTFEPVGFAIGESDVSRRLGDFTYKYALFRDGLALLEDPYRSRYLGMRKWSPKSGFED